MTGAGAPVTGGTGRREADRAADTLTLLLAVALLVALLGFDPTGPVFAAPKAAALALLAALALPWLPRPSPWLLLLLPLALAPWIAFDPASAVWGRAPRAEGVGLGIAVLVLALATRVLPDAAPPRLDRVLHFGGTLLAGSVLVGVFLPGLPLLPAGFADGHGGTLGNPNTAGAVLAALLVHAGARGGRSRWLLPLYAAALFGTGSRAAWLAMLVGLGWLLPAGPLRRTALGLLAAGALAVFAGLSLRAEPAPSVALRLELWGAALRALTPAERTDDALGRWRWLIGYGPEQQAEALERHRRPEQNAWEAGGHERVADRAHSLPLDLWLSFGLAGLAALAWMLRRILHTPATPAAAAALALLIAGGPGFFGPAEWLLLSLWLARLRPARSAIAAPGRPVPRLVLGLLLAGVVALGLQGNPASRDQALRVALEAEYRHAIGAPAARRALAERACRRSADRPQDGEAALLCAQIALAADARTVALGAAVRATRLRPARPRAWLLRLLADPTRPEAAWQGFRTALQPTRLEPETGLAWATALDQAARQTPALTGLPDWPRTLERLRGARLTP